MSYYRVKQVDFNSEFSYSETVEVSNFTKIKAEKLSILPNPIPQGDLTILLESNDSKTAWKLSILNLSGQLLRSETIIGGGKHTLPGLSQGLKNGVYLIQIRNDQGVRLWEQCIIQG
jgi:hypothetical protein